MNNEVIQISARGFRRFCAAGAIAAAFFTANNAQATLYQVSSLDLGNGYSMYGSITTDGTMGALSTGNITDWNLSVKSVTEQVYNPANTTNISSSVAINGNRLVVPTSPDGISDGGLLGFAAAGMPNRFNVRVADFTGFNANGGAASYAYAGGAALGALPLNQPNQTEYVAGIGTNGLFKLASLDFGNGITLSGSVSASGGPAGANITDWNILVRETLLQSFTKANSAILSLAGLFSDGSALALAPYDANGSPNSFAIGFGFRDLTEIVLADFTTNPDGEAGFISPLAYQTTSPLPLDGNGNYIVGYSVPEPGTLALLLPVLACVGFRKRFEETREHRLCAT